MRLKIHQPLPLNARESRALLDLLTSSFRKNLDAEHSFAGSETSKDKRALSVRNPHGRRHSISGGDGNHADRHLHSLLNNPLFKSRPRKLVKVASDESISTKDPMETFERAVALGMMDIRYATTCLLATKRRIVASSILSLREGMRDSGAGLKVLKWLKSSGHANDVEFLRNRQFTVILIHFLVAEGLQEAAWKMIKMSFDTLPATSFLSGHELDQAEREIAWPLSCLVGAEIDGRVSLDAAFLCMSRAAGYLKGLSKNEMRPILGRTGALILRKALSSHTDRLPPTEAPFESFLSLLPVFSRNYDIYFAHLNLIHPTKPDAQLALKYLRSIHDSSHEKKLSQMQISLGLDAASFLLQRQQQSEVNWILKFLGSNFSHETAEGSKVEQAKAEATSLDLLTRLGFA